MNIALTGKLRSGKDAAAAYLVSQYGYTRFAFGDALKRYYHQLFTDYQIRKPREGYQWFGQTMRQRDPDVWVRKCFTEIYGYQADAPYFTGKKARPIVITDVRQPNEHGRCRAEGFVIVRVNCPDDIRMLRAQTAGDTFSFADLFHETEQHVNTFDVDYELDNSGSLADLHAQIDALLRAFAESDT